MKIKLYATRYARVWGLMWVLMLPASAFADRIQAYFSGLETFEADFTQVVFDSNGEQIQDSSGHVWMQRPGRFRWDYRTPYQQLIVADGKQLWTYDADLEQATVKALDQALSSAPAVLLSGYRPIEDVMEWRKKAANDGLEWYSMTPREADEGVEDVSIAFDKNGELSVIEVIDGFGNHTRIRFSAMHRNRSLDADLFTVQLPEGTDLIGASP